MAIKIYDTFNKQWLSPMAIYFDSDNNVAMVQAKVPNTKPIRDGWYKIEGEDLGKISIIGDIKLNPELMPDRTEEEITSLLMEISKQTGISYYHINPHRKFFIENDFLSYLIASTIAPTNVNAVRKIIQDIKDKKEFY